MTADEVRKQKSDFISVFQISVFFVLSNLGKGFLQLVRPQNHGELLSLVSVLPPVLARVVRNGQQPPTQGTFLPGSPLLDWRLP